jgi:DNA mismatch endonuclease (patch repair protein)
MLAERVSMQRSEMMSQIRTKDTAPEMLLRRALHAAGFRYRLHRKDLPGKPDITLPRHMVVIMVNGCFWHGHAECRNFRIPKTNREFWAAKITRNVERDKEQARRLREQGWRVLTVWECATRDVPADALVATVIGWIHGPCNFAELPQTSSRRSDS